MKIQSLSTFKVFALLSLTGLLLGANSNGTNQPLEGAWILSSRVIEGGPDEGTYNNPQPALMIFSDGYYSTMLVSGPGSRQLLSREPSDEEIIEAYQSFVGNSGTYEINESSLLMHPVVAKNPNLMAGGSIQLEYRLNGDTLVFTRQRGAVSIPDRQLDENFEVYRATYMRAN